MLSQDLAQVLGLALVGCDEPDAEALAAPFGERLRQVVEPAREKIDGPGVEGEVAGARRPVPQLQPCIFVYTMK